MTKRKAIFGLALTGILLTLSGCSAKDNYVSSANYQNLSCNQLKGELVRVQQKLKLEQKSRDDDNAATAIAVVGTIIFPPAILLAPAFLASGASTNNKISQIKGHYEAIYYVSQSKRCSFLGETR